MLANRTRGYVPVRAMRLLPILILLLTSCAPHVPTSSTATALSPTREGITATAATPHGAEIRFALVGNVTSPNVWALFDAKGYSYNNYAVHLSYWPRLFHLTIPDGKFEPQAAAGMPSPVQQEGTFYTATVPLRSDLKWTDGSPFTAEDVAFTVNTALSFQLGFDWHAFYDPAYLDHAEAVDAHTVKFFFKKIPNVAAWQYGALQGPVVQKAFWSPKIAASAALLPTAAAMSQVEALSTQVADQQKSINDLIAAGSVAAGEQARQLQIQLQNQQRNLDGLNNALAKAHEGIDGAMESARQSLYDGDPTGEPTLGTWTPAGESNGTWTNAANPSHPFGSPNFDRAVYATYPDEASAVQALKDRKVNAILEPDGVSPALAVQGIPGARIAATAGSFAEFLVINPASAALGDAALRQAILCFLDRVSLAGHIGAAPFIGFVPGSGPWANPAASAACGEGYDPTTSFDASRAIARLKNAGYAWSKEPAAGEAGSGLSGPDGQPVPPFTLLAPPAQDNLQAHTAAQDAITSLQHLGLTVNIQQASAADIRYAIFSDHKYDMAIVGWRLSAYPAYLCDWFGDGNPFGYSIPQVRADCAALSTTTDLTASQQLLFDIQSTLSQAPPFIPLFSGTTYDSSRGIVYPFDHVLNGLSGVYGAPELAVPSLP